MGTSQSNELKPRDINELLQSTNFTGQEINEWYQNFMKECPTGSLTKQQFCAIYSSFFPNGDAAQFAENAFRTFDQNGDNSIGFKEFMVALSVTSRGTPQDRLRWAFQMYDIDGNGYVSRKEMLNIVSSIYSMMGPALQLPPDESTPEMRTNKLFAEMDKNHDDKLSLQEFIAGAQRDPNIVQLLHCGSR